MANILPLAFIDPFELIASLPRRMGLYSDGILPVRGPRPSADDPDDETTYVFKGHAAKWPELRSLLAKIKRIGDTQGGVEFGRVFFELLPAGACLPWTLEDSAYNVRFVRLVMALRTNPGVMHYSGTEGASLAIGYVTLVNQRTRHCAINLGESNAIFLVVDTKKAEAA